MTQPTPPPVDVYLEELATFLPRSRAAGDLLDEIRDHLYEATEAREAAGACREAAEREAVREIGSLAELVPQFQTVAIVCDARRQANRQLVGALLLASGGAAVFHLLPALHGHQTMPDPPLVATLVAAVTLLAPSLALLGLSRTPWLWWDARWLAWLVRARTLATWLFQLGLPLSAAMMGHPIALLSGSPHLWLIAGVVGGHLVAGLLVPVVSARHLLGAIARQL